MADDRERSEQAHHLIRVTGSQGHELKYREVRKLAPFLQGG